MAFNKRTWLGRQGTGLNKFSIGGATPVTIVNQPDSVTQVGDALSAGNMNDLEDRIESGFNDVDTALATKADQTEVTDLKNALSATNKRVENLEEAHGSYHEVDVKSVYTIPSGKAKNWIVDRLRGVSRVNNQWAGLEANKWSYNSGLTSIAFDVDNRITKFASANNSTYGSIYITPVQGHVYLVVFSATIDGTGFNFKNGSTIVESIESSSSKSYVLTASTEFRFAVNSQNTNYQQLKDLIITDLTVYFNGTIPSDASTIAQIQTNYPWLLTPSDYGTSAVNTVYEGVRSGIALVNGSIDASGNDTVSDSRVRSSFVPVTSSMTLAIDDPSAGQIITEVHYYNASKTWLSYESVANTSKTLTIPSSCAYLKFILRNSNQATTELSEWADKLLINNVHIEEYFGKLTFPSPISLKSAGAVADTMEPCVEVKVGDDWVDKRRDTQNVTSVDVSTITWGYNSVWGCWQGSAPSDMKLPSSNSVVVDAFLVGFVSAIASGYTSGSVAGTFAVNIGGIIFLNNGSTTTPPTGTLYYGTTSPTVTLSDPILNNLIPTEAGGTIESILTNPVDDSMTLGYINL